MRGNGGPTQLLLIVDQFEEVFTLVSDEPARVHFLESLHRAVTAPASPVRVIVTLRADFYDRPLLYPDPGELVRQRTEVVLPLSPEELARAITSPAARPGVAVEPALIGAMIQDVAEQPGTLPLLEYALTELFERRENQRLTLAAYRASGGVQGALARRADATYAALSTPEQEVARQVFLRLVTLGEGTEDTRRRVRRAEFAGLAVDSDTLDGVLEQFSRYRLLTFDREPGSHEPTVEVAHEALIRSWGRLRAWLDATRAALAVQRQLGEASAEWERADRDPSYLASGVRLAQFEALAAGGDLALTGEEHAYLAASQAEAERQAAAERERQAKELETARRSAVAQRSAANRLRGLLAGAVVFLVVAIGLSLFAFDRQGAAEGNLRLSEAQRLAAEANTLVVEQLNPELIALLSIRSMHTQYSTGGDQALAAAAGLEYPQQQYLGHTQLIWGLGFSPDDRYLLTGSADKTAVLWDAQSGRQLRRFTGHTDAVTSVAFSPDGKLALTGSGDKTARLWDVQTGQELRRLTGHDNIVEDVAFSPDGLYVATGSEDFTARLWEVATGRELRRFEGFHGAPGIVAFSPDGRTLAVGTVAGEISLFTLDTGARIQDLPGHPDLVADLAFSPDGRYLLSASYDNTARIWEVASGQEVHRLTNAGGRVLNAAFTPDGLSVWICCNRSHPSLFNVQTGQVTRVLTGTCLKAALAHDGRSLLCSASGNSAQLWNLQEPAHPRQLVGHRDSVSEAAYSPDGKYVLTVSDDKTARLWDSHTGAELQTFPGHSRQVVAAAFSPDGKVALTASWDGQTRLWEIPSGRWPATPLEVPEGSRWPVFDAVFSPDGKQVLTGGYDQVARLWNWEDGSVIRTFAGHAGTVSAVAFAPDGKHILTGSSDNTARLWDTNSGQEVLRLSGHADAVMGVAFSPDGKWVLTGSTDRTARLWDAQTGQEVRRFTGHGLGVTSVAFSPDGKWVLTGGNDKTARLWDAQTGQEVRRFSGHADWVGSAAFSPDGKQVLTASGDKTARIWDADYHDTISYLCERLLRDFTDAERAQFEIKDTAPTCPNK